MKSTENIHHHEIAAIDSRERQLVISKGLDMIVLITGEQPTGKFPGAMFSGTVIWSSSPCQVGEHANNWCKTGFRRCDDDVIVSIQNSKK